MLLCEVALGGVNELKQADYNAPSKLSSGPFCTKGVGRWAPDESSAVKLNNGTLVPLGELKDSKVADTSLIYNEFIVYDISQIKMKYLVKLKFNYDRK